MPANVNETEAPLDIKLKVVLVSFQIMVLFSCFSWGVIQWTAAWPLESMWKIDELDELSEFNFRVNQSMAASVE